MSDVDTLTFGQDAIDEASIGNRIEGITEAMPPPRSTEGRARILTAKISLPHQGFVLSRPRLRAMVEPVRSGGVVYLVAGPGYGKTAFIVDLLSSAAGRSLYFSLDEGDRDPLRFLAYLMVGLGMEVPERQTTVSVGWSESSEGSETVPEVTARLLDHMSSCTGEATLIAIDDLHLVDSSAQTMGALELIARGLPPGWTILLSSRRYPPFSLDSIRLGGRLAQVRGRDLRLTPGEVTAWAHQNWAVRIQPSEARALWRMTEGWPAALVLLGQHLFRRGGEIGRKDVLKAIAAGRDLSVYLEQHVLSELNADTSQIVLAAGLLPIVVFPRDEPYLPGHPGQAKAVLEEHVSRGFLVTRMGRSSYSLHPLLRDYAERQSRGSETGRELIRAAAAHLERTGDYHSAASLFLGAGFAEDAARPIRSLVMSSLNAAADFAGDDWLDLIPSKPAATNPLATWLIVAQARILQQRTEWATAAALYEQAVKSLSAAGDREGLLPVLLCLAFCHYNQGYWEDGLVILKRCRAVASTPREKVEVSVVEGNVLVSLCRWDEAAENWERALALAPADDRVHLIPRVHFHRSRLFYCLGHFRLAAEWASRAMEASRGSRSPSYASFLVGAANYANLTGDYELAQRYTDESGELVSGCGCAWMELPNRLSKAGLAAGRWDYRSAFLQIRAALNVAAEVGDAEEYVWAKEMMGDLCRRNRNPQRALEHHQQALDSIGPRRLGPSEKVQAMTAIGMDLAALGREEEARVALEETVRLSRRWRLLSSLTPGLFYLGWLYARQGREQEAARSLAECTRLACEHGHVHFFTQEARVAVPILALSDRLDAGPFVREDIVPRLPERLQTYFRRLTEGKTYPTDVPLGAPGRIPEGAAASYVTSLESSSPGTFAGIEALTAREREVLKMIALGMQNKQIAAKLVITEKTVKTHSNHIYNKLGVISRVQATLVFQNYQRAQRVGQAGRRRT